MVSQEKWEHDTEHLRDGIAGMRAVLAEMEWGTRRSLLSERAAYNAATWVALRHHLREAAEALTNAETLRAALEGIGTSDGMTISREV